MAILEIKKYPDHILKKKAEEVKEITPAIKELAGSMIETMLKAKPEGVGLAAPQVGISKKIFVAQTNQGPRIFVNPRIVKKSEETEKMEEGCLSIPGLWLKIKRAKELEMEALDINGKMMKIKAAGLFARILQHEIDHLNGVLIVNKVGFWQKLKRTFTN